MKNLDIHIDSTHWDKGDMVLRGLNLKTGCGPLNLNFFFTGTTKGTYDTRYDNWVKLNSAAEISGATQDILDAEDARILLDISYAIIANQVNLQAAHDKSKLVSSGGILTSDNVSLGILPQATLKGATSTVAEEIIVNLVTLNVAIGTIVRLQDLTDTTAPVVDEFFAQKHLIYIDGLISGHRYRVWVAHKGSVRKVIFSAPREVSVQ